MIIERLCQLLTTLYNLHNVPDIRSYLLSQPPHAQAATVVLGNRRAWREALFVRKAGDTLELGLYIDPTMVTHLEESSPCDLADDLGCVAEGVSHFLYIIDRYQQERSLSVLELELQGEVDKFLVRGLLSLETEGRIPIDLFERQFLSTHYDPHLSETERECYETASHFAAKHCHRLRECFFPYRPGRLVEEARTFFAKNLQEKLGRLIP